MTEPHQSGDTEKTRDTAATPQFGERRAAGAASRNEQVLFEALVRQNADALFVYVQACARDAGLAEEVFQDTLVVAWERLADYDSRRPFAAWTRGIARRLLQAKRRERSMYRSLSDGLAEQLEARFNALDARAGDTLDEKLAALRGCLERLGPRDREAIDGRYALGLRGAPLADRLQTSLENARKIVQRARTKILDCMNAQAR
ncbi:MAG: sigma-70 family RNA polymerase sigma factor [Planctomycetota bacterium]